MPLLKLARPHLSQQNEVSLTSDNHYRCPLRACIELLFPSFHRPHLKVQTGPLHGLFFVAYLPLDNPIFPQLPLFLFLFFHFTFPFVYLTFLPALRFEKDVLGWFGFVLVLVDCTVNCDFHFNGLCVLRCRPIYALYNMFRV